MSIKAFVSYSHKNKEYLDNLHTHLAMVKKEGKITTWYDGEISAGKEFHKKIMSELAECKIFIALVSPQYLASEYCYDKEFTAVLKRAKTEEIRIIPIVVEPCDWPNSPFKELNTIPSNMTGVVPVSDWRNVNTAFNVIVQEIRRVIEEITETPKKRTYEIKNTAENLDILPSKNRSPKIKQEFSSIQKSDFADESYEIIKSFFRDNCRILKKPGFTDAKFVEISKHAFTCTIVNMRNRNETAHITLHNIKNFKGFGDISYNNQNYGPENTSNGWVSVESDDFNLYLKPNFSSFMSNFQDNQKLSAQQVAQEIWNEFEDRAGVKL